MQRKRLLLILLPCPNGLGVFSLTLLRFLYAKSPKYKRRKPMPNGDTKQELLKSEIKP
jgi:hypothetical protein